MDKTVQKIASQVDELVGNKKNKQTAIVSALAYVLSPEPHKKRN